MTVHPLLYNLNNEMSRFCRASTTLWLCRQMAGGRKAKPGQADKAEAIKKLHAIAVQAEENFVPGAGFDKLVEKERRASWK